MKTMPSLEGFIQSKAEIAHTNCHIDNGGLAIGIGISANNKPVLRIMCTHFGHLTNAIELEITKERLNNIVETFQEALKHPFSEDNNTGFAARKFGS